ncbi:MAG TPA: hypothetical protein VFH78_03680 [Candidatus Thermoplasmatota archaeon]|nr:hypothetical protein [Candidatus Thermoplasmatota archaeon]
MLHRELLDLVALDLSRWEVYGLFFLLGSFAVATLSDIKHMAAQREFMDVWWAVALVLLGIQVWQSELDPAPPLLAKWVLVALFGVLSHRAVGLWLRLATADVAACVAAAMLLPAGLVLAFFLLLKLLSWPAAKLLARGKPAYPFMPVVTLATVAVLALGFLGGLVEP